MSEAELDPQTRDGLGLYPGEKVLWAKICPGEPPKRSLLFWSALPWPVAVGLVIAGVLLSASEIWIEAEWALDFLVGSLSWIFMFAGLMALFDRFLNFSGLAKWSGQLRSFLSCVITDRRVLLFNQLGERPTALSRSRLASTKTDYVEGSRALLFKSHGDRDTYAWLHASDFTAALDALGHPNLSKRGSS